MWVIRHHGGCWTVSCSRVRGPAGFIAGAAPSHVIADGCCRKKIGRGRVQPFDGVRGPVDSEKRMLLPNWSCGICVGVLNLCCDPEGAVFPCHVSLSGFGTEECISHRKHSGIIESDETCGSSDARRREWWPGTFSTGLSGRYDISTLLSRENCS